MIHASNELIRAMLGEPPTTEESEGDSPPDDGSAACGAVRARGLVAWACDLRGRDEELQADCPECLRLMREAIPPVRWDFLEERGLVSVGTSK